MPNFFERKNEEKLGSPHLKSFVSQIKSVTDWNQWAASCPTDVEADFFSVANLPLYEIASWPWHYQTYPKPATIRQRRKSPYPWTKDDRKAKKPFVDMQMRRQCLRPTLSDIPPQKKAPTIIPRYTMLPRKRTNKAAFLFPFTNYTLYILTDWTLLYLLL